MNTGGQGLPTVLSSYCCETFYLYIAQASLQRLNLINSPDLDSYSITPSHQIACSDKVINYSNGIIQTVHLRELEILGNEGTEICQDLACNK